MKELKRWLVEFNGLLPRERLGVVAALAALIFFIVHFFMLDPAQKTKKALTQQIAAQATELATVRNERQRFSAVGAQGAQADSQLADELKKTVAEADQVMTQATSGSGQVSGLLREMIRATPGVALVSLRTLPAVQVAQIRAPGAVKTDKPGSDQMLAVYRHGVEIGIKGNYLAVLPYLEKLQSNPQRLYWADVKLDGAGYPDSVLRMTIYTLSGQPRPLLG